MVEMNQMMVSLLILRITRALSMLVLQYRLQDVETETPVCTQSEAKRIRESPLVSAKQYEYAIGEWIERLDSLEEVEQGSDLYLFALNLFLRKEYTEIFLQLKKPKFDLCLGCSVFGLVVLTFAA
ncbi:hypothetical protein N665_0819s0012 [Sinapis alba]|nr:hypothetical protein N665_0819s0012 [Sinapis alba]